MTSFLHVDLQIAAIGKRRTMIIFANGSTIYVVLNATYSRIMYLIIILTIEINNDNNKNDIIWQILSLFFFCQNDD
jgi:hypothetical protein